MKALYYPAWGKVELREVPKPTPVDGEVLVRVSECGICGSELETFRKRDQRRTPPLIMGHEFCGYVEEKDGSRSRWSRGDRVIAHALIHCGQCDACQRGNTNLCRSRQVLGMHRPGAFGEYIAVPARILIPWPDQLPASSAIFAEPLANGINAMSLGPIAKKSKVVILGAGPIGLMCLFAAKQLHGAAVVISDLIPERLKVARMLGADCTVNAEQQDVTESAREFWERGEAEFVVDTVGSAETKRLSLELVEPGGAVVWLGLHDDVMQLSGFAITLEQKAIFGSYSGSFRQFQQATQLLASGSFDTHWATSYPLEEGEIGFRAMLLGTGNNIKGILRLDERESNF